MLFGIILRLKSQKIVTKCLKDNLLGRLDYIYFLGSLLSINNLRHNYVHYLFTAYDVPTYSFNQLTLVRQKLFDALKILFRNGFWIVANNQ